MSARRAAWVSLSLLSVVVLFAGCPGREPYGSGLHGPNVDGLAKHGDSPVAPVRKRPLTDVPWKTFEKLAFEGEGTVIDGSLRVSPDGRRYACAVRSVETTAWIVDGRKVAEFPVVNPAHFVFSGDSEHYLCAGEVDLYDNDPTFVLDGKTLADNWTRGFLNGLWLSHDGSQYAYLITDGTSNDHFEIDGIERVDGYSQLSAASSSFGEDLIVSAAGSDLRWAIANHDMVIVDGKPLKHGGLPLSESFHFSADGSSYAFLAEKDGEKFLVVNDEPQKRYESAWSPTLSADGDHWALLVGDPGVVFDG